MGKYSNFERAPRDFYPTPLEAMAGLLHHLPSTRFTYYEPCAGDGAMVRNMEIAVPQAVLVGASDIHPLDKGIERVDILKERPVGMVMADCVITNLPWRRDLLHPLIERIAEMLPMWTLLDSNWINTQGGAEIFQRYCVCVQPIGRLKWIEGSKDTGKQDVSWMLFDARKPPQKTPRHAPRLSRTAQREAMEYLRSRKETAFATA